MKFHNRVHTNGYLGRGIGMDAIWDNIEAFYNFDSTYKKETCNFWRSAIFTSEIVSIVDPFFSAFACIILPMNLVGVGALN